MTILRFRVYWEDDDQTYRDIEIQGSQTFFEFHTVIIKSYEFDNKHPASFFVGDRKWNRGTELDSEVLVNKKGAAALSMLRTPVSALIATPDQKFVYVYRSEKPFVFLIELIGVSTDVNPKRVYPFILRREGISPAQYGIKRAKVDKIVEIEEKYDLSAVDITDGFEKMLGSMGDEDDSNLSGGDEEEAVNEEEQPLEE